jgi:hypothetical protein
MSLATPLSVALQDALAEDVLVVAAAGNHGCACDTIPASVAGVLAVGAHDETGAPLLISNWGPGQRGQGLLARGSGIPGTCVGGGLCRGTGTSFATALVSGLAALLMSLDVRSGRRPSGTRVRQVLLGSADPCLPDRVELCSTHLAGRLNLDRAVDRMLGSRAAGGPPDRVAARLAGKAHAQAPDGVDQLHAPAARPGALPGAIGGLGPQPDGSAAEPVGTNPAEFRIGADVGRTSPSGRFHLCGCLRRKGRVRRLCGSLPCDLPSLRRRDRQLHQSLLNAKRGDRRSFAGKTAGTSGRPCLPTDPVATLAP